MPAPTSFTTSDKVKAWLKITSTDVNDDTFIAQLMARVDAMFTRELGWNAATCFQSDVTTELYDGNDAASLFVRKPPINSVTTLKIGSWTVPAAADHTGSGYIITGNAYAAGEIRLVGGWVFTRGEIISVSYNGGFSAIPADLDDAAAEQCAYLYRAKSRVGENAKTLGAGSQAQFETGAILPHILPILQKWQRVEFTL